MTAEPRIAVVGLGGLFPGAADLDQFWANIAGAVDTSREVPPGRWLLPPNDVLADGVAVPDHVHTSRAYYLDQIPVDSTDLRIAPELFARLDPVFHLILHVGRQAFAEAATAKLDRSRVGVILGHIALPTEKASALALEILGRTFAEKLGIAFEPPTTEPLNRYVAGLPAGILAKALGLGGGTFTLDAACASSLYALKLAADELRSGRADLMLTGGASRPDCLYTQMGFAQLRALSPRGRCSPFDAAGDGLVVGEGCGILALKRLDDALRDGNTIHAILAGEGLSNDIEGSLLAPANEGQLRAMTEAYRRCGWSPSDVDVIECHATGTPVGDAVEFASLRSLWSEQRFKPGQCVIGSVKSTVGHLLTGASSAGLIKLILAMRNGTLPPTANFRHAGPKIDLGTGPFRVLQQAEPWQRRNDQTPRRAAISGFGFGGINAHVLLEEYLPTARSVSSSVPRAIDPEPIAVVGMEARFGPWQSLRAFRDHVFGNAVVEPTTNRRWWGVESSEWFNSAGLHAEQFHGYFIDEIEVSLGQFRIPPKELEEMLPQQLLALQVAAAALQDCQQWERHRARTGVFLGLGLDLNTTNFHFRWWIAEAARRWRHSQIGRIDDREFDAWLNKLREAGHPALNANRTMGALGSIAASRVARAFQFGGPSYTICSEESSAGNALEIAVRALQQGELDMALAGGVDLAGDVRAVLSSHQSFAQVLGAMPTALRGHVQVQHMPTQSRGHGTRNTVTDALETPALIIGEGAAVVVLKRLSDAKRDGDRIYAIIRGIGAANGSEKLAASRSQTEANVNEDDIGYVETADVNDPTSVHAQIGYAGAASFMASFVRACLALQHNTMPNGPRYWLTNRADGPRRVAVRAASIDGNFVQVLLEESPESAAIDVRESINRPSEILIPFSAPNIEQLAQSLDQLEIELGNTSFSTLAAQCCEQSTNRRDDQFAGAILARSKEDLSEQLRRLRYHLAERPNETLAMERAFFEPNPLGGTGKLAFVFPGSGNHYAGMGRELALRWPAILQRQQQENVRLRDQFAPEVIWNDRIGEIDPVHALFGQVTFGCLVADILAAFGVRPQAAIGYSLGESVSMFALQAWNDRDEMLRRMQESTLFTTELGGPCRAARQVWKMTPDEPLEWIVGVVGSPAAPIREELGHSGRVYLLIVNTPDESVIGGERRSVEALVRQLGRPFIPLPAVTIAHCELTQPIAEDYRNLHLFPTTPPPGIRYYSGVKGASYDLNADSAADSILGHALGMIDYPRLIEQAYADGVRLFVEVGPGASCSRMIGRILSNRPHFTRSASVPTGDENNNLLRLLATLHVHRVPLDFSPLNIPAAVELTSTGPSLNVKVGGEPFQLPPFPTIHAPMIEPKFEQQSAPLIESPLIEGLAHVQAATADAQAAFLRFADQGTQLLSRIMAFSNQLLAQALTADEPVVVAPRPILDTAQCFEYAAGSIGRALGPTFAEADAFPTRVRLPDGPLMLVDNIWEIDGEPRSMTSGRVVTDHHVHEHRWYAGEGHIPTSICVEAGQADLFLSGYLGIDFVTRGLAVYRLLDAVVTFHRELPRLGETIRYDIRIDRFFRQGETHLFRFQFDGTVNGEPLLTMREGCAGFFTAQELAVGRGIIQTALDRRPIAGKRPDDWHSLAPLKGVEAYDAQQLAALRSGDLAGCFGAAFAGLPVTRPLTLPGEMLQLVDRVTEFDPTGGRFGLGRIRAEMDIHPDDWFLTCHFVDDMVMPGTLMYECCLHTLRVGLLRMGWIGETGRVTCEPVPGVPSQLKCRGQVIVSTKIVTYEISIKELGYRPEPFAICDALMYADGKPIVEITNMSLRMSGATRAEMERLWTSRPATSSRVPLFDRDRITAFAIGKPSDAFGDRYRVFDSERIIARLPGPPYQFLDRIMEIRGCEPWKLEAGGEIVAEYDVPADEWYFAANRQPTMPFAVLLEIALQPCGWLAGYLGSALTSDQDLAFRNLGGKAIQHIAVGPDIGTLKTWVKITRVSTSGGMIIQSYDFRMMAGDRLVYDGDTTFGFFSRPALAQQVGVRDAKLYQPDAGQLQRGVSFAIPDGPGLPDTMMRMMDRVELFVPDGGSKNLGFIRGKKTVNPQEWFFKAHFFQDPVWPGSLGLEAFLQLLKVVAERRWGSSTLQTVALGEPHSWIYRGQVIPTNGEVTVEADITNIDDGKRILRANGFLSVDGRTIYQMTDFSLQG